MENENNDMSRTMDGVQNEVEMNSKKSSVWSKQIGGEKAKKLRKKNSVRWIGLSLALLIFASSFLALGAAIGAELIEDESKDLVEETIIEVEDLPEEEKEVPESEEEVVGEVENDECFDKLYESIVSYDIAFLYDSCKFQVQGEVLADNTSEFRTELVLVSNKENNSVLKFEFIENPPPDGGGPFECRKSKVAHINANTARMSSEVANTIAYIHRNELTSDYTYISGIVDPRNLVFNESGLVQAVLPDLGLGEYNLETIQENADFCKNVRTWKSKSGIRNYEDLEYGFGSGQLYLLINAEINDNSGLSEEELIEFDEIVKTLTY